MGAINCREYKVRDSSNFAGQGRISNGAKNQENNVSSSDDVIEKEVCHVDDITENEMKEFELNENQKVLLVKKNGNFYAIGTKCSHYGAPLIKGALGKDRIRCPWHGACFNLETGDIEDFPGLDSIPCYKVNINESNQVKITARKSDLEANKRIKNMKEPQKHQYGSTQITYVIIGGGPAGGVCVETLRQEGFTGRIVMICKENVLPYDRVKISKSFSFDIEKIQFRDMSFYEKHGIEVLLGTAATKVDTAAKIVECSNGQFIQYDKLFIATGVKPRRINVPGSNLKNIATVREYTDVHEILEVLNPEMEVVCLGASFIGLESAASLAGKVKKVTVIGKDEFPLKSSFGEEIGKRILKLFEDKGVNMIMKNNIVECMGDDVIKSIKLQNGEIINCDLLILGIGSTLYTEFLKDSGIVVNKDGSIDTDMHLRTNILDVYVGGDIANAPVFPLSNQRATISHYQLAQYHARIAALNMVGKLTELRAVPFFFTALFGKGLRYSGYGKAHETIIDGDLETMKFIVMYLNEHGHVIAMASCNRDPIVAQFAEFQSQGRRLHKNDLKDDLLGWTKLIV